MNYSDVLLKRIRQLNRELARYSEPATPEESAERDVLLEALAWYVHKLQMRVLPKCRTASVSPGAPVYRSGRSAAGVDESRRPEAR